MKVEIPAGLVDFATEFSKAKTPAKRTKGWVELPTELRGEGDVMDTIGTLMLWRYLVAEGIPCTYHLTAGTGDETDIRVQATDGCLDLNVKTSKYQPRNDERVCELNHIPVKEVEFGKTLADLFVEVFVHLEPPGGESPHVHLCNWIARDCPAFQRQEVGEIPNTGGSRGFWIDNKDLQPIGTLVEFLSEPWLTRRRFLR